MTNNLDPFKSGKRFSLRWFTPTVEVPLCGHATLASAAVLFYVVGNQQVSKSMEKAKTCIYPIVKQI